MERIKNGFDVEFYYRNKILKKRIYLADIKKFMIGRKNVPQNRWLYVFFIKCDNEPVEFDVLGEQRQNTFYLTHFGFSARTLNQITNIEFYKLTTF